MCSGFLFIVSILHATNSTPPMEGQAEQEIPAMQPASAVYHNALHALGARLNLEDEDYQADQTDELGKCQSPDLCMYAASIVCKTCDCKRCYCIVCYHNHLM